MDNWTMGAFSDSIEENVKKLNTTLYRVPELPLGNLIKPRKRPECSSPSSQLQKTQQNSNGENNNSVTNSTTHNKTNEINNSIAVINNEISTETKSKVNQSMNTSSNENINDFILVELVI